jgi:hypothetical protein
MATLAPSDFHAIWLALYQPAGMEEWEPVKNALLM